MSTTKFKPGDRVAVYTNTGRFCGKVFHNRADCMVDVLIDGEIGTRFYHPKQLRRLKKKTRVVWESECRVGIGEGNGGVLRDVDDSSLSNVVLSKFIGKRVRIEITEAKEK